MFGGKTNKIIKIYVGQSDGKLVESIPGDYEIYENPNAQVFLRKVTPKIIAAEEVSIVENGIKKFSNPKYFWFFYGQREK